MSFWRLLQREYLIAIRQPKMLLNGVLFFVMICFFFPLSMPADSALLTQIAAGVIWIATLLSMLLISERLFQTDFDDGVMEQWLLSDIPLPAIIFAKLMISWLMIMLPILLVCPLLVLLFNLPLSAGVVLALSLLLGTPALLCLCALSAAFSTGMQQKGVFMALIVLPMVIPILIFGSGTINLAINHLPVNGELALLLAFSIITITCLPFAIAAVIRINMTE